MQRRRRLAHRLRPHPRPCLGQLLPRLEEVCLEEERRVPQHRVHLLLRRHSHSEQHPHPQHPQHPQHRKPPPSHSETPVPRPPRQPTAPTPAAVSFRRPPSLSLEPRLPARRPLRRALPLRPPHLSLAARQQQPRRAVSLVRQLPPAATSAKGTVVQDRMPPRNRRRLSALVARPLPPAHRGRQLRQLQQVRPTVLALRFLHGLARCQSAAHVQVLGHTAPSLNLFGAKPADNAAAPAAPATSAPSLFGAAPAASKPAEAPKPLFGAAPAAGAAATPSLFGAKPAETTAASTGTSAFSHFLFHCTPSFPADALTVLYSSRTFPLWRAETCSRLDPGCDPFAVRSTGHECCSPGCRRYFRSAFRPFLPCLVRFLTCLATV